MKFDRLKRIPKKISPSPIAESLFELRFDSDYPADALVGTVYNCFRERYPEFKKLPVTDLPQYIRDQDPSLKYVPYYRMSNDSFVFQIGPRSFTVACPKEYLGWDKYFKEISWVKDQIVNLHIISKPHRIGVRYINFFKDRNVFDKLHLDLNLGGNSLTDAANLVKSEFIYQGFRCIVQITNQAMMGSEKGSSLDIDVICDNKDNVLDSFDITVSNCHSTLKQIFFNILGDDYLDSLNPEY